MPFFGRPIAAALESTRAGRYWGGNVPRKNGTVVTRIGVGASARGTAGRAGTAAALLGFGASMLGTKLDAKPSAPTLTGTPLNNRNDLAWNIPAGNGLPVTGYTVTRTNGATTVTFDAGNLTSYVDTTALNGVAYTYRVQARNAIGNLSNYSNAVVLTPTAAVPAAPVLAGTAGDGAVDLTWATPASPGSPLQPYTLQRRTGAGAFTTIASPAANATSYHDAPLANGTQVTYQLIANNLSGPSQPSNSVALTPLGGGAPVLPADQAIGRAASDYGYWGGAELHQFAPSSEVAKWRTLYGFNILYGRIGDIPGAAFNGGTDQILRAGSALVAPYATNPRYAYQRNCETTGPFKAKAEGQPIKVRFYVKLHKPRNNSFTGRAQDGNYNYTGDLGPFGGDIGDPVHRAEICAAWKTFVAGAKWLGCDGYHFDPEFGSWDIPWPVGRTMAQHKALLEQFGYEFCKAGLEADPNMQLSHYGLPMLGGFHEEVGYKNGNSSDGAYFHTPGAVEEDQPSRFALGIPTPLSPTHAYQQDQGFQSWSHRAFFRGMWKACGELAGPACTWTFQDAFWYHVAPGGSGLQYGGVPSEPTPLEYALRWNLLSALAWLSRDPQMSRTTRNWLARHLNITGVTWVGTDPGNGYFNTQLREPDFSGLVKALRKWGMGGQKVEYSLNTGPYPTSIAGNIPSSSGSLNNNSRGRPLLICYGFNPYRGHDTVLADGPHSGVLGNAPTGGGSPGQTITYGPTAATPASPVDWSARYVPPPSRAAGMLAGCSTASIGTSPPTITGPNGTGLPTAVRTGTTVVISGRIRHEHAPRHVSVYRGAGFNRNDPEPNYLSDCDMWFEPNNGTNRPTASLVNTYHSFTITLTGMPAAAAYYVLKGESTKEDEKWLWIQSN